MKTIFCNKRVFDIRLASIFLIAVLLSGTVQFVHAAPIFGSVVNTVAIEPGFNDVAIKANGSHVYVGYTDLNSVGDIGIAASSDNGTTFPNINTFFACVSCANFERSPQIAVSAQYLYVAWLDGDGDIAFARSDDNGATFNGIAPEKLTFSGGQESGPHIAVYGNNVYINWIDNNGKVVFEASHDSGSTWPAGIIDLSESSNVVSSPQMTTAGSNVYVAWQDLSEDPAGDINSTVISQNGTQVGSKIDVSNTSGIESLNPQIAAFKNSVYNVWSEAYSPLSADVFFASSANDGASFGGKINLSNSGGFAENPQIAADNSKVYVVWDDPISATGINEVLFKSSQNNGTTFSGTINLSANAGPSVFPKIAISGDNVFVVWTDYTIDPSGDVLFKSSSDDGATFGGLKKLNTGSNVINENSEEISASSENISAVWSDALFANYIAAVYSPIEVQFDSSQYSLNSTATITVTDPSANTDPATRQTVTAAVKSSTDPSGITSLTLTETADNNGIFSGTINFTSTGSTLGTTLLASAGDTLTATYSGQSSIASIYPITVSFDFPSGYDRGSIAHVTVNDPFEHVAGLATPQAIKVHVTSLANPAGIDLQLTETAANSYTFAGDSLIFMDKNNLFPSSGTITINQTNTGANVNPNAIDTIPELVTSTNDPVGITMNLNETGNNTGIFSGKLALGSSSINHVQIKVAPGDILSVTRVTATENGLITPNPNPSVGAILVTPDPTVDTIIASYHGVSKSVPVSKLYNPGGGGGGLVRPGLVLDIIASLAGHGGNTVIPPSFSLSNLVSTPGALPDNIRTQILNFDPTKPISPTSDTSFNYPLYIDGAGYLLGGYANTLVTKTEHTGVPIQIKLNIPASNLQHLALYTNLHGTQHEISDSDTYIIWEKGQPLQIVDPHGYFDKNTKVDVVKNGINNVATFSLTFVKPMEKSDIDLRAWDDRASSSDAKLLNAIEVLAGPSQASSSQSLEGQTVKSALITNQNAEQSDVLTAIKDWGGYSSHPISDSELLSHIGIQGKSIPAWVTKTVKYVADGDLTPEGFARIVQYLAFEGIVK